MRQQQLITNWETVPVIFDLPLAARLLGCNIETLKRKAQKNELPGAVKFGKQWRVAKGPLMKFIESGGETR